MLVEVPGGEEMEPPTFYPLLVVYIRDTHGRPVQGASVTAMLVDWDGKPTKKMTLHSGKKMEEGLYHFRLPYNTEQLAKTRWKFQVVSKKHVFHRMYRVVDNKPIYMSMAPPPVTNWFGS